VLAHVDATFSIIHQDLHEKKKQTLSLTLPLGDAALAFLQAPLSMPHLPSHNRGEVLFVLVIFCIT
jgi:hypothetical protein